MRESYPAVSRLRLSYLNRRLLLYRETAKTTPRSCSPLACKNRAMDEQIGAKRSREGEMSAGNHDFLEDSNRKRFFEYRSIDRSILWRECGEHLDLKLANWKSGKVEFAWVDLNKRRFERCNLTGNQLAMKGWYKKTG